MEIAISPISKLPTIERQCPQTKPYYWPTLPTVLTKELLPYNYEPHDEFFYQQVDHNIFIHPLNSYTLDLKVGADMHVELYYNFLLGDLVIKIEGGGITSPIYGVNEFHRNVLNVKNLAPGSYTLTIYEPTSNDPVVIGCNHFLMSMHVDQPSDVSTKVEDPHIDLPSTLNSIAYLKYSNKMHIQSDFVIVQDAPNNKVGKLDFSVTKQSLLRATVDLLSPFDLNLISDSPRQHPSILETIEPGQHTLYFYLRDDRTAMHVLSDLELALIPLASINTIIGSLPCKSTTTEWVAPSIILRPTDGYYQFRDKKAYLLENQLTKSSDLYTIPFELKMNSVVSVQLQYDFIVSDLSILVRNQDSILVDPTRYGTNSYNLDDIKVYLTPGHYALVITQTLPWPDNPLLARLPCAEFDLRITISTATSIADRTDCTAYAIPPWDFNTEAGGSSPYGGPLRETGVLSFFYDRFLLVVDVDQIAMHVRLNQPSVISVYLAENTWQQMVVALTQGTSVNSVVQPLGFSDNWFQKAGLYKVDIGDYFLRINYVHNSWQTCSSFGMGVSIEPVQTVASYLQLQCSTPQKKLPTTLNVGSITIDSYFTEADLSSHIVNGHFQYNISFTTSQQDYLDVSFTYYSLSSLFTLTVYSQFDYGNNETVMTPMVYGEWDVTNDNSNYMLTQSVQYTSWEKGLHILSIEQPVIPKPDSTKTACIPFSLSFQLIAAAKGPIIRHVAPPSGTNLNPAIDLYIEIRFSESVFDAEGNPITRFDRLSILARSLYLFETNSPEKINPKEILSPQIITDPDDYTRWLLLFGHNKFKYGASYQLSLEESQIFTKSHLPVTIPSKHEYTMINFDTSCSGSGTYVPASQTCVCYPDSHRAGAFCDKCENGYFPDKTGCIPEEDCLEDTCGCYARAHPSDPCKAIGKCTKSSNPVDPVKCSCPPRYYGSRCNKCADGYDPYPDCYRTCVPPCAHGICNNVSNVCTCYSGYTGADCNQVEVTSVFKVLGLLVLSLVSVGVVGVLVWWWLWKKPNELALIDPKLEMELEGGRKFGGVDSDSESIGLGDDDEHELPVNPPFSRDTELNTGDADSDENLMG